MNWIRTQSNSTRWFTYRGPPGFEAFDEKLLGTLDRSSVVHLVKGRPRRESPAQHINGIDGWEEIGETSNIPIKVGPGIHVSVEIDERKGTLVVI